MFTKALILVLLGSTFVVCSPEADPRLFSKNTEERKPGPIRRVIQRGLNFTVNQGHRIGRVVKGAATEVIGVGKDIKDVAFGTAGDVASVAVHKWDTVKNGTLDTVRDIAEAFGEVSGTFMGKYNFLDKCIKIPRD